MQITEGSIPPDFKLKDQDGRTVSLSQSRGKPVVLYFYPADETPGCTKQVPFFSFRVIVLLMVKFLYDPIIPIFPIPNINGLWSL